MDNNFEDFFTHDTVAETDPVEVEDTTIETPETEISEVAELEPETPAVDEHPEPETRPDDRKDWVPVKALQDERTKARTAIDEANTLRQQIATLQAQQSAKTIPDPFDDPQGFIAAQQQSIAQQVAQQVALQNLNHSRNRAEAKYGSEKMTEIADWAGQQASRDPTFEARLFAQADPAEWVIAEKQRNDDLTMFTTDREAFLRAEFAKLGLTTAASQTPMLIDTPPARKMDGPTSIVSAKSRDSAEPMKPADTFDAIFGKPK